jgi:hypothetical protein
MCKKTKIKLFRLLCEVTTAAMVVTLIGRAISYR